MSECKHHLKTEVNNYLGTLIQRDERSKHIYIAKQAITLKESIAKSAGSIRDEYMQLALQNRIVEKEVIKVPKSAVRELINHKHYRAFIVFLQLKPLYVSGVILNDAGNFPYPAMAAYLGLSISGLRGKIKQLKKHKLIKADRDKNFHLASYQKFVSIFKPQFLRRMKKYTYKNVAPADQLIKVAAIQENFRKQKYVLKNKIIQKEIYGTVHAPVDRIKQPEGILSSIPLNDCHTGELRTDLSKTAIRKIRSHIMQDWDNVLHKHKIRFLEQMEQLEHGYPAINPYVTLSCGGIGRLFGRSGGSGHYQREKLLQANVVQIRSNYHKIAAYTPAVHEKALEMRKDIFSYNYPVKRSRTGREEKFFLRLPDLVNVNLLFVYENAKN